MIGNRKHLWLMALACAIPLLIIIALPLFGIEGKFTWIALIVMFALHVIIMGMMGKEDHTHEKGKKKKSLH